MDASTVCQLKCPVCPTAQGVTAKCLGRGYLKLGDFKTIIDKNPELAHVELSNWGELFLNKDLVGILQYAYRRNVALYAGNGANLNTVSEAQLRAVVKYKLRKITCSIDGASQASYAQYRVNGNYDQVIANVRTINRYKKKYRSIYPKLRWQFVAFGHNEHEIGQARALAAELGMDFGVKLSWSDLYGEEFSPVKDKELIRRESGVDAASRAEYRKRFGHDYLYHSICRELWTTPQVNHDGRVLGCSINHWGDYGNAFADGLGEVLNGEAINYARAMLMGQKPACDTIPCTTCKVYQQMAEDKSWLTPKETESGYHQSRRANMVELKILGPRVARRLSDLQRKVRARLGV